jgi:hypothetical protein
MWAFITAAENLPFSVALLVMLGVALLEGVGLLLGAGLSGLVDALLPDIEVDVALHDVQTPGALSQFLGWLYVGKVPFLVVFIVLLTSFGVSGLIMQSISRSLLGSLLPAVVVAPVALLSALPVTRLLAAGLARIMPRDETEAVSADSFIGRVAVVTTGTARLGSAAQARLHDQHGQTHYVMVEPETGDAALHSGSEVLLIKKNGNRFVAIANPNPLLVEK